MFKYSAAVEATATSSKGWSLASFRELTGEVPVVPVPVESTPPRGYFPGFNLFFIRIN